jgi:hypothetical protein
VRNCREPTTTWLPSTYDLFEAPERAILAALDANLQLAIRSLRAEYPVLDENGRLIQDPDWEPYIPPQVSLIERIVASATDLRRQIIQFRATLHLVLRAGFHDLPHGEKPEDDDDIPF